MGANNRESDDTNGYNPLQKLQYESELKRLMWAWSIWRAKNASQMTPKHKPTVF